MFITLYRYSLYSRRRCSSTFNYSSPSQSPHMLPTAVDLAHTIHINILGICKHRVPSMQRSVHGMYVLHNIIIS